MCSHPKQTNTCAWPQYSLFQLLTCCLDTVCPFPVSVSAMITGAARDLKGLYRDSLWRSRPSSAFAAKLAARCWTSLGRGVPSHRQAVLWRPSWVAWRLEFLVRAGRQLAITRIDFNPFFLADGDPAVQPFSWYDMYDKP